MPDDNPPVDQGGAQGRRLLNVNQANVGNVKVTRMDVNTGEIKELQADLLKEVCDCIDAQTKTLKERLEVVRKTLKDTIQKAERRNTKDIVDAIKEVNNSISKISGGGYSSSSSSGGFSIDSGEISKNISEVLTKAFENLDIEKYIGEMAQTFAAVMPRMMAGEGGAAAGGASMGGGASDIAAIRAAMREYEDQAEILENGSIAYEKFFDLFEKGVLVSFKENINRINTAAFRLGREFSDLHGSFRDLKSVSKTYYEQTLELTKTGHANLTDFILEFGKGRQDIVTTFKLIRSAADQNLINPLGILGDSVIQVSENLESARQGILTEGFDMSQSFRNLEEMNESMLELVTINKRAGIMGDLNDAETQKLMARQFEALKEVSLATGKTIPELLKAQKEDTRQLEELVNAGIITQEEMENLRPILKELPPEMSKLMMDAIRAGGVEFGFEMLISSGHELATQIAAQLPIFKNLMQEAAQGNRDASVAAMKTLENIGKGGSPIVTAQMDGAAAMAKLTSEINTVRETLDGINKEADKRQDEFGSGLDNMLTDVITWFDQNIPEPLRGLGGFIAANTAALFLNTAALLGINPLGFLKKLPFIGKFLGGGAAATGAGAGAGALGAGALGTGLGVGALTAILGATGLAAFGITRATGLDDWINEEGVTGEGTIGTYISDLFGADATTDEQKAKIEEEVKRLEEAAKARREQATGRDTVQPPTQTAATRDTATNPTTNPVVAQLITHTERLTSIESILLTANDIGMQIRDTIGSGGAMSRTGDTAGPSPVGRNNPSLDGNIQAFESALDVGP